MKIAKILVIIFFILYIMFNKVNQVASQTNSSGYAVTIPSGETVEAGDIICVYPEGFVRCLEEYDVSMYGVVVDQPSVSLNDSEIENPVLTIKTGIAEVKVSTSNGDINEGDFITTSTNAGVGMKADRNGYVLGSSLEDYSGDGKGTVQVVLNIHPAAKFTRAGSNLLRLVREGVMVPLLEPLESLRYLLAILMVLISFTLGMVYFGRSSRAGIEAIGRNPLAKRVIQFTVVMNIVLTIVIVLVGLGIAYLILVL